MGNAPPPDALPPAEQDIVNADAGFALGPPAASICGFVIPTLKFKFSFSLNIKFPPHFPWPPFLHLSFSCDPLGFEAEAGLVGGGRVGTMPNDPDA